MMRDTNRSRSLLQAASVVGAIALATLAVGCGDDEATGSTDTTIASSVAASSEITVAGQWARTSPAMASMGAAYVTITSATDDALVGAKVDASVAATAEVHETVMAMGSETTTAMGGGQMSMRPVASVALPAGVAVEFEPGGYHIMLVDLAQPLEVGTTLSLTLRFEKAGEIVVEVPVLDEAP